VTYAGVELGGTKCVLLLGEDKKKIIDRAVHPTGSPDETLSNIEATLLRWQQSHDLDGIGIASFGPLDLDPASGSFGIIRAPQKPGWDRVDLLAKLKTMLSAPIALDTDVNGAGLAEMRWGAGQGLRDFAYITVGTGVGVGLIVAGHPIRGFGHCELGHIRVARLPGDDWPGSCPLHGDCVEGLASGSMLRGRFGDEVSRLRADDLVWHGVVWALAQLCHTIACATAPKRIVMGGGVLVAQPHLLSRIDQKLRESLNGFLSLPDDGPYVTAPGLGADAGPLGAIALAMTAKR
jgi:fructokinase